MLKMLSILLTMSLVTLAQDRLPDLRSVAHVAAAMLDGDMCLRIRTARSIRYSTMHDPRDPWRAADNYDVNATAFIQTKKTLIRLAHLCPEACDVNLWMPAPSSPGRVEIVIRNQNEMSQFWHWGDLDQEMPPEMKQVFEKAEEVTVQRKPNMTSVLAPVHNNLGDVVALAEVVSQQKRDPRENVK
jgi:hypothetical protein